MLCYLLLLALTLFALASCSQEPPTEAELPSEQVTLTDITKIHQGMTLLEVEKILGTNYIDTGEPVWQTYIIDGITVTINYTFDVDVANADAESKQAFLVSKCSLAADGKEIFLSCDENGYYSLPDSLDVKPILTPPPQIFDLTKLRTGMRFDEVTAILGLNYVGNDSEQTFIIDGERIVIRYDTASSTVSSVTVTFTSLATDENGYFLLPEATQGADVSSTQVTLTDVTKIQKEMTSEEVLEILGLNYFVFTASFSPFYIIDGKSVNVTCEYDVTVEKFLVETVLVDNIVLETDENGYYLLPDSLDTEPITTISPVLTDLTKLRGGMSFDEVEAILGKNYLEANGYQTYLIDSELVEISYEIGNGDASAKTVSSVHVNRANLDLDENGYFILSEA